MDQLSSISPKEHWQQVYAARPEAELSWFESVPNISLDILLTPSVHRKSFILDVGGGTSRLVDALLDRSFTQLTVLDIADTALETSKQRLGERASRVRWIAADITQWQPDSLYSAWHDRAVFHFLTTEEQRRAYRAAMEKAVEPGGIVVIGTFALDGPERCSGLPVQRYSAKSLAAELGDAFRWTATRRIEHTTPAGNAQRFQYSRFIYEP